MARPRILNPDDAKALRKLGLTYTAIGELLGVSHQTVRRACDDQARARLDANAEKRNKAGAPCPACGERMAHTTAARGGMCHACNNRARRSWVDADGAVDGKHFDEYRDAMRAVRSSDAWRRARKVVLDRDAYTCQLCGAYGDTVDHYPPLFVQLVRSGRIKMTQAAEVRDLTLQRFVRDYAASPPAAQFRVIVNPMVQWIWIGATIVFLGGLLCLWPAPGTVRGRVRARYAARVAQDLGRA